MEKIVASAIQMPVGRKVGQSLETMVVSLPRPHRHHHIIHTMTAAGMDAAYGEQGFITNFGRFVDRHEGMRIAKAAHQVSFQNYDSDRLFSEDLW